MKKLASILIGLLLPSITLAAPAVSGVSGVLSHGERVTITGSAFGSKSQAAPVAWDNLEDGACNTTATVGTWSSVGNLVISADNDRHSNSAYCATGTMGSEKWNSFTGGSDDTVWYVQYWVYLGDGFSWDRWDTNIKIFRLESTGPVYPNLRVQFVNGTSDLAVEGCDEGHGGYEVGWTPATSTCDTVDECLGYSRKSEILGGDLGFANYYQYFAAGTGWHLLQFQFSGSSGTGVADGTLKEWIDGKLVVDVSDITTKCTGNTSNMRPNCVGWYRSPNAADATSGNVYFDDAYIDNTWARVEIGNANTYAACTHREIQPATAWTTGEIAVTLNRGSFGATDTAYLYVVDADGAISPSYEITFGEESSTPAPPTISNATISNGRVQ